jgi:hypothetical protein
MITFLAASNNNLAATVLDHFVDAVIKFGVQSSCDHGGENMDVCSFMEVCRVKVMMVPSVGAVSTASFSRC